MPASPSLEETRRALADEWLSRDPADEDGIAAFYRESTQMAADLDAWHATPERQSWTDTIVQVARQNESRKVLDVGAGGGHDLLALREWLPDQFGPWKGLYAVEPNEDLRGGLVDAEITTSTGIEHVEGEFDLVLLIDVLEHVPDPETLLAEVVQHIPVGGLLIESTATDDQTTPLHLPQLKGWMPDADLIKAGFQAAEVVDRLAIWERVGTTEQGATLIMVAHREISCPTVDCMFDLVGRGWPIALVYGDALIDRARAKAVSAWYRNETTDVFLMVDDDIVFRGDDAERVVALAREKRSIAIGAYPVGDGSHLACRAWPGERIEFGPDKEPKKMRWPATGFMAVHRDVVAAMVKTLPLLYPQNADAFWPMFQPFPLGADYLSEDYAFGQRALDLGFETWLDPKTILIHLKVKGLSVLNMPGAEVTL